MPKNLTDGLSKRLSQYITEFYGNKGKSAFSESIGMHQAQLSTYMRDVNPAYPSTDVLARFQAEGMSIDWLLSGRGAMRWVGEAFRHHLTPGLVGPREGQEDQDLVVEVKVWANGTLQAELRYPQPNGTKTNPLAPLNRRSEDTKGEPTDQEK